MVDVRALINKFVGFCRHEKLKSWQDVLMADVNAG